MQFQVKRTIKRRRQDFAGASRLRNLITKTCKMGFYPWSRAEQKIQEISVEGHLSQVHPPLTRKRPERS